jgi:hypothetical protein
MRNADDMEVTLMAILGIVLAAAALIIMFAVEWLKRPRLEIRAGLWRASLPVPWVFAAVEIRNRPLWRPLQAVLVRESALGCEVTLEFRVQGQKQLAIPEVAARWSGQPEPIRSVPVVTSPNVGMTTGQANVTFVAHYDQTMVPQTLRFDVPAADVGQEVAIAMLRQDGTAHAWGAESYAFPEWKNPVWQLQRQVYEVTVGVQASGISKSRRFLLDNLAPDFARFGGLRPA